MAIPVKLPVFEGPLDLLLHLIDKNKIDIYDIPIVEITDQYLEYIHHMEREDLDIMSEFMVMAATLLDIKCRMLLPKEVNEEGEEEDPRAELVQQLLEYKMYKYMSYELRDRMNEASRSVYKEPTLPREVLEYRTPVDTSELLSQISLAKLHTIYKMILKRQEDKIDPIRSKFGKIEKEEVSLPDKMTYVEQFAVKKRRFSFRDLLESQPGKVHVIVTFLAILELMKTGKIRISQEELFGDILIESLEDEDTVVVPYTDETDSEARRPSSVEEAEAAIEAVLFAMGDSVELGRIAKAIGHDTETTRRILNHMMEKYNTKDRGIHIVELENAYQMCTKQEYYDYLVNIAMQPKKAVLTDVMMETLSIIAYKQPVTKQEIDKIRGVKSDHAVNKLVEYNLVQELGRLDAPGRPIVFGTTEEFLRNFGVDSTDNLPEISPVKMEDFRAEVEEEMQIKLDV